MMTVAKLGELLNRPKIHQLIVGDRKVPYALGVSEALVGPIFTLKIADPTGIPEQIVIDGNTIQIVTHPMPIAPVPQK